MIQKNAMLKNQIQFGLYLRKSQTGAVSSINEFTPYRSSSTSAEHQ